MEFILGIIVGIMLITGLGGNSNKSTTNAPFPRGYSPTPPNNKPTGSPPPPPPGNLCYSNGIYLKPMGTPDSNPFPNPRNDKTDAKL